MQRSVASALRLSHERYLDHHPRTLGIPPTGLGDNAPRGSARPNIPKSDHIRKHETSFFAPGSTHSERRNCSIGLRLHESRTGRRRCARSSWLESPSVGSTNERLLRTVVKASRTGCLCGHSFGRLAICRQQAETKSILKRCHHQL